MNRNKNIENHREKHRESEKQSEKHSEYWWNVSIKTATKVPHNKPDLIIWN